jgi:hypothetical protein
MTGILVVNPDERQALFLKVYGNVELAQYANPHSIGDQGTHHGYVVAGHRVGIRKKLAILAPVLRQ